MQTLLDVQHTLCVGVLPGRQVLFQMLNAVCVRSPSLGIQQLAAAA